MHPRWNSSAGQEKSVMIYVMIHTYIYVYTSTCIYTYAQMLPTLQYMAILMKPTVNECAAFQIVSYHEI